MQLALDPDFSCGPERQILCGSRAETLVKDRWTFPVDTGRYRTVLILTEEKREKMF
jgi:hypothetical protein